MLSIVSKRNLFVTLEILNSRVNNVTLVKEVHKNANSVIILAKM
jgi:hypothetical protein